MSITVKRAVTALISVVILILITTLIVIAIRPIPLPFLSSYIRSQLDNRFHAYYVDFEYAQTRWRPIKKVLEFHLNSVYAADYGENVLATVPKIVVALGVKSFPRYTLEIREVELQNPKISLIRTDGGALKFDLGNSDDGSSGRILKTILINIATTSTAETNNQTYFTGFRILNSDLTLGDEISGSLLHVSNANINLIPNPEGIGCNYDFSVFARGEYLHFSGECLYKTADEKINLLVNFDEVRPALLTEILPQFNYFTPLEVRLSGKVQLELDKFLTVHEAVFDLRSGKGTLEIIEYFGSNLEVNSVHITGKALNDFSHIEFDKLTVDLEETKAEINALFLKTNNKLDIKLNAHFKGTSISTLLPRWFTYLENEKLNCLHASSKAYTQSSLTIDGTYDLNKHHIKALGHITCLDKILSNQDSDLSTNTNLVKNSEVMQKFRMDGPFTSPNLATIQ